jgi:eukaryotic-like serine/threonine-protein kinase
MSTDRPQDTTSPESDFGALWSSDGATRSFSPTATATSLALDLPFLFAPGQRFGPYLIVRPLGKGGMGQVYEAEETESGRRIAMKILSRGLGDDEERERFLHEGRLAASLSHPNTVYVFGTTEVQGFPVIAMELAPGGTLKELLVDGKPLAPAVAVDAILQVIAGLDAAAALGILHRDIKPSNCFVDRDGRVLVGDFGLSMTTLARDETTLAVAGTIMGTPGFASPEQLRGEALDVRSDIYSVGATLYYLLTGRPPFDDKSIVTLMTRVATEAPPVVTTFRQDVPSRLAALVAKCLSKTPGERYANYPALAAALEPFRSAALTPARPGRRFLAGCLDSYVASLPVIPLNMYLGSILDARNRTDLLWSQVPAVLSILAYYTVLEGRFGCGVGKAVLNLRVIDETQVAPGMRRAFLRAAIFLLPAQIVNMILGFLAIPAGGRPAAGAGSLLAPILAAASIAFALTILAIMFSTARRRNGYAGLHDRATNTRVVLRPRAVEARKSASRTMAADRAVAADGDRLGPYLVPPGTKGTPLSAPAVVQGFDDRLRRQVWVEILPAGTPPLEARRRDLGRPTRTRWLSGRRADAECWDAYEALDGQPFLDASKRPQPWSRVRHWLADLSDEIAAGMKDGSLPRLQVDRIWIGSDDRARLLDWPSPTETPGASARLRPSDAETLEASAGLRPSDTPQVSDTPGVQRFLYGLAAGALSGVHPDTAREEPVAMPLPLPARTLLEALRTGALDSLDTVRAQAETQLRNPADVPVRRRAIQIGVCAMLPVFMPIVVLGAIHLLQRSQTADPEQYALKACLDQLQSFERLGPKITAKQQEQRDAIEVYITEHLQDAFEESAAVARAFPVVNRARGEHVLAERAIAKHPQRSPAEVKNADEVVAKVIADHSKGLASLQTPMGYWALTVVMAAFSSAFVGVLALLGSLIARGGFTFRPFGVALVIKDGRRASRLRACIRPLVAWLPIALLCTMVIKGPKPQAIGVGWMLLETSVLLVFVAGAIWAIFHPVRGIQDRIAGTRIVPR